MRVLVSTVCFPPAWKGGGSVRSIGNLTRGLSDAGAEVRVVTTDAFMEPRERPPRDRAEHGFHVTTLPVPSWLGSVANRYGLSPALPAHLWRSTRAVDVCVAQGVWTFPLAVTSRLCRLRHVPYVLSARGSLEERSLGEKAGKKRLYYRLIEGFAVRNAAALLYSSEAERRRSAAVTAGRPAIILPNPLEAHTRRRPPPGYLRDRWDLPPDCRIVGMSGRIHPRKGFELLIPALAREDSRICCVVFGPDDGDFTRSVVRSAAEHGISDRFRLIGHLDGEELETTYAALDLLVLPSLGESFGNVVLEALAQGTEVLLSSEVPLADYVESNQLGSVVAEPTAAAWASALSEWATRENAFDSERAAERVRRDFDRDIIGRRLFEALCDVVGSRR